MRNAETIVVNSRSSEPPPSPGFSPQDIVYVLFRHKWKILLLTLLGVAAGSYIFVRAKPFYVSEASLLVKYVVESRPVTADDPASVRNPDSRGENIINAELAMINSFDLVEEVVSQVGASNIVRNPLSATPISEALSIVRRGVTATAGKRSNVINVSFTHGDAVMARTILTNLIDAYFRMHQRVHSAADTLLDVAKRVDQRRRVLEQTQDRIRELQQAAGVVDVEETKKSYVVQIGKVNDEIRTVQAQLADSAATLGLSTNVASTTPPPGGTPESSSPAPALVPNNDVPAERVAEYRNLLSYIQTLIQEEQQLRRQFTKESPFVKAKGTQISDAQHEKETLEKTYPGIALASGGAPAPSPVAFDRGPALPDRSALINNYRGAQARLGILTNQLADLERAAMKVANVEVEIVNLRRQLEAESRQYLESSSALERARLDDELSKDRLSNIEKLQEPTPALPSYGNARKLAGALSGGGFLAGLLLAFLLELKVDRTIRRPAQVERDLQLPLFLSIPQLKLNGSLQRQLPEHSGGSAPAPDSQDVAAPQDDMTVYAEALRDRLMMHFQLHGLNHKPKLVGVSSCGHGAGVTTLATRLAASLSETGDGNVLYVGVNQERGAFAHPFKHGKLLVGIRDALDQETRDVARVQENLYMVSLADPSSGKVGIVPKTLSGLVPRMKASDYDYIIFDLPPITQTSATAKVAGLLDMTFVVVESEKTQTDLVKKATALLGESRANVAAVLNKHERYLPRKFDTDL